MLRILAAGLLLAMTAVAQAEQVTVQSGEHDGFTRLVLDFAGPVGWQMARTPDGYRLALDRPDMRFDLSGVFRPIRRDRLASIWADPASGALMLGIGCACHAFPFELSADVLVIDLRDGPAPPGSVFELSEQGQALPPVTPRPMARPRLRPAGLSVAPAGEPVASSGPAVSRYDWLDQVGTTASPAGPAMVPPGAKGSATSDAPALPLAGGDAELRAELLRQIGHGVARGTVDLAPDAPRTGNLQPGQTADTAASGLRIGRQPGIDPAAADRPDHALTAIGTPCLPDDAVDLAAWGDAGPVAQTIAARTGALYGEFDRVDAAAADSAVRYLLHLGFGAEVQRLIDALDLQGEQVRLWASLAHVVDGDLDPDGPLAGMEVCDGAVALWALLARPDLAAGDMVQSGAILRAFSALPPHLRRHLGPTLAGRFLARGDAGTVRAIRDAILRPGGDPGPAVRLMEAELHMAAGDGPDTAALIALQSAGGPTAAAATIAAIGAIVAGGGTVDVGLLTATEALLREYKGADEEPPLRHALALAQASQGAFDAAFGLLPEGDPDRRDLWALLADQGGDSALLTHALPGALVEGAEVALATRHRLARRLIDAGFPDAALGWLGAAPVPQDALRDGHLLLAAEAELRRRDARAAIGLLASVAGPEATALRNEALMQLGTAEPLARVHADAAAPDDQRQRAARMALDWAGVAQAGPEVWRSAATVATSPPPPTGTRVLARADALIAESAAARAALQALLDATAAPAPADPAGGS
ncbi:MAG: hypothetical protein ACT4OK_07420 [Gemmobacter sp.]